MRRPHRNLRAGVVLAGLIAAALATTGVASAASAATHAHSHSSSTNIPAPKAFSTNVADVTVYSQPRTTSSSVGGLGAAGSQVTVDCYVVGQRVRGDRIWYHATAPTVGYVAGKYLHTGHDPARGVWRCHA